MTLAKRCRCPNNTLFIIAVASVIFFLLVELAIRTYNLYRSLPFVDVPSHFFAGVALGTGGYWIISLTLIKRKKFSALGFIFIGAVLWEILETLEEWVVENPQYLKDVFFWDGFSDILVTLIGGATALGVLHLLEKSGKIR